MLPLYALTMFFSAALLFAVQPLFARMALPLLGGSPSVWNTALVFYQATLLAGYVYADVSTRILGVRRQALVHVVLLLAPLLVLPIGIAPGWMPPTDASPIAWLLMLLAAAVGLPFFVVSTTAPLLQRWFATTRHPSAADPYFLYATSNAGSFLALLSYPLIVERFVPLTVQGRWWTVGYVLFAVLVAASAVGVLLTAERAPAARAAATPPAPLRDWLMRRARWLLLALVPSSLMLAVTTHISMDLAAVPLLWVVPLSIYLLTFVLVFARRPPPHRLFLRLLPITALAVAVTFAVKASEPLGFVIALHLVMLFVGSMVCHGELAGDRPTPDGLTEFYLWMATGGVLGGLFNVLVAPLVFRSIAEYPLMVVAAVLIAPLGIASTRPAGTDEVRGSVTSDRILDVALPTVLGVLTLALAIGMSATALTAQAQSAVAFGVPALIAFAFSRRSLRFALALVAILIVGARFGGSSDHILHSERTFFGVHRVSIDAARSYRQLLHGRTIHGRQSLDPARRREPIGYFSPSGPIGQILLSVVPRPALVAVVGLGNGTLAAYALAGESWTFFEIDPAIERIARDPTFFTYLADSPGAIRIVLGDGRLALASADDRYDIVILDAYSSEAIPQHLLTREALRVYLTRLAPQGLLAFHISNRHFDLIPVVAALARDAGLVCRIRQEDMQQREEVLRGNAPSTWAVIARDLTGLGTLVADPRWRDVAASGASVWTDDHSSPLSALR
jgi:spermidine synthase